MNDYQKEKNLVLSYFRDMEQCSPEESQKVLESYVSKDYCWEAVYPFLEQHTAAYAGNAFWKPFKEGMNHLQRRQDVFIAGKAMDEKNWVMSMGQFMGLFDREFLGIRPTGKIQHLQYIEFNCVEDGMISHTAFFVDLVGFMVEAGVNPMTPETGHYFVYPGPRDHNGLHFQRTDNEKSAETLQTVVDMLTDMYSSDEKDPETMRKTWAEDMIWYGPCGIGASYTIPGYQKQHQFPFCDLLSDRKSLGRHAFFAEGNFACFYTSLSLTSKGGWLGMPGGKEHILMWGDVDVYYCKDGKISENWCYIDLPNWLHEQGVDIFERSRSIYNPQSIS